MKVASAWNLVLFVQCNLLRLRNGWDLITALSRAKMYTSHHHMGRLPLHVFDSFSSQNVGIGASAYFSGLTDLSLGIIHSIPQYSMQSSNKASKALKRRSERAKTMRVTVHTKHQKSQWPRQVAHLQPITVTHDARFGVSREALDVYAPSLLARILMQLIYEPALRGAHPNGQCRLHRPLLGDRRDEVPTRNNFPRCISEP